MLRFSTSLIFAASVALGLGACLDQGADLDADTAALEREGCVCAAIYEPVCGVNGVTYSNACRASCAEVSVATAGECETTEGGPTVCAAIYEPVCGANGVTYSNACVAAREHAEIVAQGECETATEEPTRMCPQHYDPVCGAGGRTYGNACMAAAAHASVVHTGECGIDGDICGGFAGFACAEGFKCRYEESNFESAPHADAAGECVPANYCDATSDCGGFPNAFVPGRWSCDQDFNTCGWQTNSGWVSVPGFRFRLRPYTNNADQTVELVAPANTTRVRFVNLGAFGLENGYDKLIITSKVDGRTVVLTGTSFPARGVVLDGSEHTLRLVTDRSRILQGFDIVAEFTRH